MKVIHGLCAAVPPCLMTGSIYYQQRKGIKVVAVAPTYAQSSGTSISTPTRVLFLNTCDVYGADVGVHLTLMGSFHHDEAEVFMLSNSEAKDAGEMRDMIAKMPHVRAEFLPLGRAASVLAGMNRLGKLSACAPIIGSLVRAAAFIRRQRIQVIHATDRPRDAASVALLGRMTGAASVIHSHANVGQYVSPLTRWGFRNSTAIFTVSEFIRNEVIGLRIDASKIYTVHNATDTYRFDPDGHEGAADEIRRRYGIPPDAPLVGIIARLTPWKGQRELIAAVSLLRESYPDLHAIIVGGLDTQLAEYEELARAGGIGDRVHIVGTHKDVRPFLEAIDIFVHPSYQEPFGLSITEAMAMRKPVIACASGGVPEIITHGKDGWLVEPRSAEAVAQGIATLLDNPQQRRQMGELARETVFARFSPTRQCALVAQRYRELTTSRRSVRTTPLETAGTVQITKGKSS